MLNRLLENKTVLFIAPVFYGYEKVIGEQMEKEGASVIFYPERKDSISYKFVNNFKKESLIWLQQNYYAGIYEDIKDVQIDYVFIIRGFLMPLSFIEKMRNRFPPALFIMHQWDSIKNNNYEKCIDQFDKFFSFDPTDCATYPSLKYLPNFYLPLYAAQQTEEILYDISFVGWAYENRIKILQKIASQIKGKTFFKHCYLPPLSYIKNIFEGKFLQDVKLHSLSLLNVYKIVQQSFSILDIADVNQTGYTYRSIDAMASNKKLITTNSLIQNEQFYDENNILIIDRKNPKINPDFFKTSFKTMDISKYSLENWIKKIFTIN